jgi:hypothetical protein
MATLKKFNPKVLRYTQEERSQSTVRRHYLRWRDEHNLPVRCDNPDCVFYSNPLVWNGQPLKPILDHKDGNNSDNRPEMLQLLCPNCDSQLPTRGGSNKGRIEKSDGGFAVIREGKRHYVLPVEPCEYAITCGDIQLVVTRKCR